MDFWTELIKRNNFSDLRSNRDAYYALIKLIVDSLRDRKKIKLPNFGEFRVTEYKAQKIRNIGTGQIDYTDPQKTVKFTPCAKLREYVKNIK